MFRQNLIEIVVFKKKTQDIKCLGPTKAVFDQFWDKPILKSVAC